MSKRRFPPGYQTLRALGTGQTSHVFLTEHQRFGVVALKLPKPDLPSELRRLFENEVQLTLTLEHPNIIRAFEGNPTGEGAFLALEHCDGGTLDQKLLDQGQMPLEHAYHYILQVAAGLNFCHQRQVLHRDVKPANIFLTRAGGAKLGDFGTGIFINDKSGTDLRVGTAFYMAPEVFQGEQATIRSDVYGLGILSYEVLGGIRPFTGETQEEVMMAHLSSLPKRLSHHRSDLSEGVSKVISKSMSRDSAKRHSSVQEFVDDLKEAAGLNPRPEEAQPQIGRASRRPPSSSQNDRQGAEQTSSSSKSNSKSSSKDSDDERPSMLERLFGRKKK